MNIDSHDATAEEVDLAGSEDEALEEKEQASYEAVSRGLTLSDEEKRLLAQMEQVAREHRHEADGKVEALVAWIRENCCPKLGKKNASWTGRRLLIFTEYTTTKTYLKRCLERAIEGSERAIERIETFVGGMSDERRQDLKTAFNASPEENALRILIATDSAREGVNLQNHCYDLFHFDVPWNPARMEQRNGRLDRKLQRNDKVYCRYFYYTQRREDEVLKRLVTKSNTIMRQLGTMTMVVNRELEELMADGIQAKRFTSIVEGLKTVGERGKPSMEEAAARKARKDLPERLEALRGDLAASRKWLCLEDDALRKTLSTALLRQGGPALARGEEEGSWTFPDSEALASAGPNWEKTLDTLRKPRKAKEKPWDWREANPVRPVVFEDTGNMDGKQVHLHLEHRVSTRLLKTLRTGHGGLNRMTVVPTTRVTEHHVLLFWRLSLYGRNAGRLHDEILCQAAVWKEDGRVEICDPATSEAQREILFAAMNDGEIGDWGLYRDLPGKLPGALTQVVPALQELIEKARKAAKDELQRRGKNESARMVTLIEGQGRFLEKRIAQSEDPEQQDVLKIVLEDESLRAQFTYERDHWKKRLEKLGEEVEEEPRRIREDYKVVKDHDEPLAIAWLWAV